MATPKFKSFWQESGISKITITSWALMIKKGWNVRDDPHKES